MSLTRGLPPQHICKSCITETRMKHFLGESLYEHVYFKFNVFSSMFFVNVGENSTDTYCIASKIQDDTKIEPIVTNCSTSLPWACIATRDQDRTKCVYTTIQTEDTSVTIKPSGNVKVHVIHVVKHVKWICTCTFVHVMQYYFPI